LSHLLVVDKFCTVSHMSALGWEEGERGEGGGDGCGCGRRIC
jgi:hypothetical protein